MTPRHSLLSVGRMTAAFTLTIVLLSPGASPSAFQSRDAAVVPPGTALVQGRVVTDDAAARPVRGAIVTITGIAPSYSRLTATDDQGRFLFADLPVGDVTLTAVKAGYLASYYGARRPGRGPAVPLAVGDGPRGSDITIRLMHGGAIAGTIVGLTGRPQAGVLVTPFQSRTVNGQRMLVVPAGRQGAVTDDLGRYRIWGLAPGEYVITAAPPTPLAEVRSTTAADLQWAAEQASRPDSVGAQTVLTHAPDPGRTVSFAPVYYPGGVDPAGSEVITLGPADERAGVDITLQVVPTVVVGGTVLGLDGQPVPNVQVMLASTGPLVTRGRTGAETDADGHFAFRAVAPGEFTITARAPSRPPRALSVFDLWASWNVTVNGDQDGLVLILRPGVTVSGRVRYDGTTKPPEDLTRVLVNLTPAGPDSGIARPSQEPVSADGTFALPSVAPGQYRLSTLVNSRGPAGGGAAPWFLKSALSSGQDVLDSALEVAPGQDVADLTVVFSDRQTDLSGTVVDTLNHPVADDVVVVFPTDRRLWISDSRRIREVVPGADGHFGVAGLPAGDYYLGAITRRDAVDVDLSDAAFLEEVARVAVRTTLADGEQKVQNLRLGGK
jgi:protocatechuate 3,4-dioxygenase beta subunit